MFIRALQSRGIFACHCQIEGDRIRVGILILQREMSGACQLVATDNPDDIYNVEIPEDFESPAYDLEMKYAR